MPKISRALLSVSDKTGIVEFARLLKMLHVDILSTGGTATALRAAGIAVIDVSEYTGSPEILDGRLKTLHPKIHGGLLGIRAQEKHVGEMRDHGIQPIDLVVVNLYPFEETIAKEQCTLEEAMEHIDIGGPTMLRAAAKNHQDVAVVVDPADYETVMEELQRTGGSISGATTFRLAQKVFASTARYDAAIATHLSTYEGIDKRLELPRTYAAVFEQLQLLRYGENPHQRAAFYRETKTSSEPTLVNAKQLQGKELSYNNIMDADGALNVIKDFFDAPYAAAIIKHANPCGVAVSPQSLVDAFERAKAADLTSAFGGIVALNRMVEKKTAEAMVMTFFEVVVAPAFEPAALEVFAQKKNVRLLEVPRLGESWVPSGFSLRKVAGGLLLQDRDLSRELIQQGNVVTKRAPTDDEWQGLEFAWRICKHVKSNAIVLASKNQTLGIGAGQMSRVDAVRLAVMKKNELVGEHHRSPPLVLASDAFFPFRDGVEGAAKAHVTAIVQPGGSLKDNEVIAAANDYDIAMVFTGFRHFFH